MRLWLTVWIRLVSLQFLHELDRKQKKKAISQVKNQQGQGMSKKMMIPQKYHQLSLTKSKKRVRIIQTVEKK